MPPEPLEFLISDKATLTVLVYGKEGPRFVQCFQKAYAKLPERVRVRIEDHWKSAPPSPQLTFEDVRYFIADDLRSIGMAVTDDEGHRIRFAEFAFGWLAAMHGAAVAVSLIVHELAHVHSWAEKRVGVLPRKEEAAYRRVAECDTSAIAILEQLVDARMEKWGVDPKPLRTATDDFMALFQDQQLLQDTPTRPQSGGEGN